MDSSEKMELVLDLAEENLARGEMPIAACVFSDDRLIARAWTSEKSDQRLLVHAELKALLEADALKLDMGERKKCRLFTNLEPCLMCYGAALSFYLGEICYSLKSPHDGAFGLVNFSSFKSDYLSFQKPIANAGYGVSRSKALFVHYLEATPEGWKRDFARTIIESN